MDQKDLKNWGPLAALIGQWEGDKGDDIAPGDDRGTETNKFREVVTFEAVMPAQNHEQMLYGLRYHLKAWRIGEQDPFHEETGFFSWEPDKKKLIRSTVIPRGMALLAGGAAEPDAKEFSLSAQQGSATFGIVSNPFLDREFKTVAFDIKFTLHNDKEFSYEEDTQIQIKGKPDVFHHRDKNRMKKVG